MHIGSRDCHSAQGHEGWQIAGNKVKAKKVDIEAEVEQVRVKLNARNACVAELEALDEELGKQLEFGALWVLIGELNYFVVGGNLIDHKN